MVTRALSNLNIMQYERAKEQVFLCSFFDSLSIRVFEIPVNEDIV